MIFAPLAKGLSVGSFVLYKATWKWLGGMIMHSREAKERKATNYFSSGNAERKQILLSHFKKTLSAKLGAKK